MTAWWEAAALAESDWHAPEPADDGTPTRREAEAEPAEPAHKWCPGCVWCQAANDHWLRLRAGAR